MVRAKKRVLATSDKKRYLTITKTNKEISGIHKKFSVVICSIWILICLWYCIFSYFQTRKIDFNFIFVVYPIFMSGAVIFFNTLNRKFNKLLRDIVEQLNLKIALNQKIKIEYTRNNESTIMKVFSVIDNDKADLLVREIASYFQRELNKPFMRIVQVKKLH